MHRVLEPELMDDESQAVAYAAADFSTSNQWFVDQLVARAPHLLRRVLDIGCGPADVAIRLAAAHPDAHITAADGSRPMIALARRAVRDAGLDARVTLLEGRVPGLPLEDVSFDAVLSKDLLHHLPEPSVLWTEARRLGRPGAALFVMDLHRPATRAAARAMVKEAGASAPAILQRDFFNSLCAAFTIEEVEAQLTRAGLGLQVARASERHMLVSGFLP